MSLASLISDLHEHVCSFGQDVEKLYTSSLADWVVTEWKVAKSFIQYPSRMFSL